MASSTIRGLIKTITTPSINVQASTNLSAYVPNDAVLIAVITENKTAFAKFAKNPNDGGWWVQLTDWSGQAITGTSSLTIKYII